MTRKYKTTYTLEFSRTGRCMDEILNHLARTLNSPLYQCVNHRKSFREGKEFTFINSKTRIALTPLLSPNYPSIQNQRRVKEMELYNLPSQKYTMHVQKGRVTYTHLDTMRKKAFPEMKIS